MNIENKDDCFVIQCSFEQITNENQNVTERLRLFTTNQSRLWKNDATPVWREETTGSSKFYSKTEKNDLNEKTETKMLKQNDVNWNLRIVNESHAKTKNDEKQIAKNDFNKKTIFVHEIHEWLNLWNFCMFTKLWNLIIWTVFVNWANKCQNMWWWTTLWCQKKMKFGVQWTMQRKIIAI